MNKKILFAGIAGGLLLFLFILSFLVMGGRFSKLSRELDRRDEAARLEMEKNNQAMEMIRQNLLVMRRDNGQIRELLQLPPVTYPPLEETRPSGNISTEDDPGLNRLFFAAVDTMTANRLREERLARFGAFLDSSGFQSLMESHNLKVERADGLRADLTGPRGREYSIEPNQESPSRESFTISSLAGESRDFSGLEELGSFLIFQKEKNKAFLDRADEAREALRGLDRDERINTAAAGKHLRWTAMETTAQGAVRRLQTSAGAAVVSLGFDNTQGKWFVNRQMFDHFQSFRTQLIREIEAYDNRDPGDIAAEESLSQILALRDDRGFTAYLENQGLTLSEKVREDYYYFYVDFLKGNGEALGSLGVQKHVGDIYIMDANEVLITSLKTLGLQQGISVKKKIVSDFNLGDVEPLSMGKNDIAFLLIGANEGNTDTLMMVHFSEKTGQGTIITLPRDLYYKGRKINSIYPRFGPARLKNTLSEITGVRIDRYIYIDMFAFADVIDLLGGIDIVLKEALIDPTYRVRDNGKWSTLYYPAGPVHLGGIEALRVARSRHTSSDFGRAERQQQLLLAVKDKVLELNAGDLTKILDLIQVLFSYVETDFSPLELFNIYRQYRNAGFRTAVLSWDNVLYNSYSNTYMLEDEEPDMSEEEKGAWILLPVDNDWSLISRFISRTIQEGR